MFTMDGVKSIFGIYFDDAPKSTINSFFSVILNPWF